MADPNSQFPNNLHTLPPRDDMNVGEVLAHCTNEVASGFMRSAIVIGLDPDGGMIIRASRMSMKDANWLLDIAKLHALGRK